MVWLNRSPIPVGRSGLISSFKWFLPACLRVDEGGGGRLHPVNGALLKFRSTDLVCLTFGIFPSQLARGGGGGGSALNSVTLPGSGGESRREVYLRRVPGESLLASLPVFFSGLELEGSMHAKSSFVSPLHLRWNSWTAFIVEVSGHKLDYSHTRVFVWYSTLIFPF